MEAHYRRSAKDFFEVGVSTNRLTRPVDSWRRSSRLYRIEQSGKLLSSEEKRATNVYKQSTSSDALLVNARMLTTATSQSGIRESKRGPPYAYNPGLQICIPTFCGFMSKYAGPTG